MSDIPRLSVRASDRTMNGDPKNGDPNRLPRPRSALHRSAFGAGTELSPRAPDRADGLRTAPTHAVLPADMASTAPAGCRHFRAGAMSGHPGCRSEPRAEP